MTFLVTLFLRWGVPARFAKAAAWIAAIVAALGLLWLAKTLYDRSVIDRHETKQLERAIPAINRAAEDRANDALTNALAEREREQAIAEAAAKELAKPPAERATLPPTTVALNCDRLKRAGLTNSTAYRERCQ